MDNLIEKLRQKAEEIKTVQPELRQKLFEDIDAIANQLQSAAQYMNQKTPQEIEVQQFFEDLDNAGGHIPFG